MESKFKPDQVPPEVVNAFKASSGTFYQRIADALNAWPGAFPYRYHDNGEAAFILPLPPQENENG